MDAAEKEVAPRKSRRVAWLANVALAICSVALVLIPFEFLFRHRYAHLLYVPRAEVRAVQQYLTLDPELGFRWQPNVSPEREVRFTLNDIEPAPLSTDEFGIINVPAAIQERRNGRAVDIIGLGDSFMEIAHRQFYERFRERGLFYYSFALHRLCPGQYNVLLDRHAAMSPRTIIYGVFENDFNETSDWLSWQASGVDWFQYHSGTWCGPPIGVSGFSRFMRTRARGWYSFGRILDANLRGERVTLTGPTNHEIRKVADLIAQAKESANQLNARFILVLIPSKQSALEDDTLEGAVYDDLIKFFPDIETVDLRKPFREHSQPESLYYEKDSHWNERGVALAFEYIFNLLETSTP